MKLSLLQENLSLALSQVSRFTASKSQLPILSHILFKTEAGRLKLSSTNLEIGLTYWLGAKIEQEGELTIPAKEITEFVSYLPSGKVDLTLNSQSMLEVVSPKVQSVFATQPTTDFPILPSLSDQSYIELDSKLLVGIVDQVAYAAASDDTRPVLMAVLCRFTQNDFSLVATDGFRLSLKTIKLDQPLTLPDKMESLTLLIPSRTLSEIAKLSKLSKTIKIGLTPDSHQLIFVLGDLEMVSRLVEGDFPDYKKIIPSGFSRRLTVNKDELAQAVKIASVFARESANVIKFSLRSNSLELSSSTPQVGQNKASVDARLEGEPLDIAFNYRFVSDFLSICQGSEVSIELNEPLTPGLFRDSSDPDFTHIIMPVRIQD